MQYAITLFVALFAWTLSACANSELFTNKKINEFSNLKITLNRSSCYGFCPSYIVELSGNGNVSYCGVAFVEQVGLRKRQIDPIKVQALYNQILQADFFSLRDSYIAQVTDSPYYVVSVSVDGRIKRVTDYVGRYAGMPESVTNIQNSIDQIAGSSDWIGVMAFDHQMPFDYVVPECKKL